MARKPSKAKSDAPDRIEWVLAAISAVVVVLLFGFLAVEALVKPDTAPTISLEAGSSRAVQGKTYVEVAVHNSGRQAAADVEIAGTANGDESLIAHAALDYAPAESEVHVTLVFDGTVAPEDVAVRVAGFRTP